MDEGLGSSALAELLQLFWPEFVDCIVLNASVSAKQCSQCSCAAAKLELSGSSDTSDLELFRK